MVPTTPGSLGSLKSTSSAKSTKRTALAISSDGKTLVVSRSAFAPGAQRATHAVYVWSNAEGLEKLPPGAAPRELLQPGTIKSIALDAAGARLFAVCDDETMQERWLTITDTQSGERRLVPGAIVGESR